MDDVLDGLNQAQKAAVTSEAKVLQVLAPPGSGKTKTLTARVGYLISHHGFEPRNIIVCTFTVKAAREMQDRISGFLGKQKASRLVLGTFHSISRRYLSVYGDKIGLPKQFSIADTSDTLGIISRIVKREKYTIEPKVVRARISSLKSQSILAAEFSLSSKKADQQEIAMIYTEYEDHLERSNLLDFDDLLLRCTELLRRYPSCVSNVQAVLIDEFQDTNNVQYDLMSLFAQEQQRITIVGDPDQSIYGWRNAEIRNLKRMQAEFPETHVAKLEENYRTSGAILLSAQEVIEQDQARPAKRLVPTHSVGMRPVLRQLPSAAIEAQWVLSEVKRTSTLTGQLLKWSDYAILLRSAALSRHIESALGKAGIPYRMVGGHKFFDRLEVKLVLDYLRVIHHPNNNDALARILNVPTRKVGDATIQRLHEEATARQQTLWTIVLGLAQGDIRLEPPISTQGQRGLELFVNVVLTSQKRLRDTQGEELGLADFIGHVLKKVNIEDHLRKTKPEDFDSRWANVQELITQANDVEAECRRGPEAADNEAELNDLQLHEASVPSTTAEALTYFLTNVALSAESQRDVEAEKATEQLTISTIHAAKGLEWPVVFIPACYDGIIPHSRAEDHDEERRLLYVAMTRAQSLLYLSCPLEESSGKGTKLSPFLSQKPMASYFDKCGAVMGHTTSVEIADILRRPRPSKSSIDSALASIERARDDQGLRVVRENEDGEDNTTAYDEPSLRQHRRRWSRDTTTSYQPATSMQQRANHSISNAQFSTTFVTAATALSTIKAQETANPDNANVRPARLESDASRKRKLTRTDSESNGQSKLSGYFAKRPVEIAQDITLAPDTFVSRGVAQETKSERPIAEVTKAHCIDTVRITDEAIPEDQENVRPAKTFHTTSISSMQQTVLRKTLGVRRSMNGWAARNTSNTTQFQPQRPP